MNVTTINIDLAWTNLIALVKCLHAHCYAHKIKLCILYILGGPHGRTL